MFKKSKPSQGDLFKSISGQVSRRKRKKLEDPASWHNVFYEQVTRQIDEQVFSILYSDGIGRPNASVRVLVAMMILKEGNGWSDEQLFDQCSFNLMVMRALGFQNLDEDVPVESTYYEFRRALVQYMSDHEEDLMKACFQQLTSDQIAFHKVDGSRIRMDSKQFNSNIARSSRIEVILEGLRIFVKKLEIGWLESQVGQAHFELLQRLQRISVSNVVYELDAVQREELLQGLGLLIEQLLALYKDKPTGGYDLLERILEEHYVPQHNGHDEEEDADKKPPTLRAGKDIGARSLQSVHDPEAGFGQKGQGRNKQMVKGYHANITETCSADSELKLIVDVEVKPAYVSEADMLIPAEQASEELLQRAMGNENEPGPRIIEHNTTDGGYDSTVNRSYHSGTDSIHWNIQKMKGSPLVYQFYYDDLGDLQVKDRRNGKPCQFVRAKRAADKWVIKSEGRSNRYMTQQEIKDYLIKQELLARQKQEDRNIRPNVEATIHQVFHRLLKGNKMKYRGAYKGQLYVLSRALWANFRRINKKIAEKGLGIDFSALGAYLMPSIRVLFPIRLVA